MRLIQGFGLAFTASLVLLGGCDYMDAAVPSAISPAYATADSLQGKQTASNTPASTSISDGVTPASSTRRNLKVTKGRVTSTSRVRSASAKASRPAPTVQQLLNVGQQITPLAPYDSRFQPLVPGLAKYPSWQAGQAVSSAVSPDGNTLLILTSGFNRIYNPLGSPAGGYINIDSTAFDYRNSQEYVFIFDISKGVPKQKQVVTIPNSYSGLTFDPSGKAFYVSGGMGDYPFIKGTPAPVKSGTVFTGPGDNVHVFALKSDGVTWAEQTELVMGHLTGIGLDATPANQQIAVNNMVAVQPMAAGVAISSDGQTLVVANYYNDSLTAFTGGLGHWTKVTPDIDLRPGDGTVTTLGTPGGEYPFWVVLQGMGQNVTAYVSSMRDREIDVVSLGSTLKVTGRIPVKGEPVKMTMNKAQSRLYVAEDMSDTVDVIDISSASAKNGAVAILETIPVVAPAAVLKSYPQLQNLSGANTNSVTLSPDESQLYVTNGNLNSVAVVPLSGTDHGDQVAGLIPTGWYPNSVSFGPTINSPNGYWVYVVNGKSPTGSNAGECYSSAPPVGAGAHKNCLYAQHYNPQLIKAGFQSFPQPTVAQLATLTSQAVINNRFASTETEDERAVMDAVHKGIHHVIFVIKENRGYDQVLGDLEVGNGDPSLTEFGAAITPNQHNLANTFITLDNFMASSETSNDGWPWTVSARAPDVIEKQFPVVYSGRGLSLDGEGENRNVNVAIPTLSGRVAANPLTPHKVDKDGDELPGVANTAAPDGPDDVVDRGEGYLWDAALRAHLSVRNYGFFVDTMLYGCPAPAGAKCMSLSANLTASDTIVAYPTSVSLTPFTDPYYRGFDNQFPDYYRFKEWERDFTAHYATGGLPALSLVRLMHDHTGNFNDPGGFKINTPELQVADNDYAVGLLIQKIADSPLYASNTLIFVIEDDSQDSGDHVDSHRTIAFVAGAYVKQKTLISSPYNTINFLRTIEEVLGVPPMNLNDAVARPMTDIFNTTPNFWSFTATVPASLYYPTTALPLTAPAGLHAYTPTRTGQYWARATRSMNFTSEDEFDFARYNRVLWKGLMGNTPYPAKSTGKDLRQNREALMARYKRKSQPKAAQPAKPSAD
jgi:DNA-binding beta-propeller fold protein YncE